MSSRRRLLIAAGASVLAAPHVLFAQQPPKIWRIGFLAARSRPASIDTDVIGAFTRGMLELGYIDGKNIVYEWRFADGKYERLPGLAADLVKLKLDLIVAATTPPAQAARQATRTIPIVMASVGDPVRSGLVESLARPGGNITGVTNFTGDTSKKQLDMLVATLPKLSRVAVLINTDSEVNEANYKSIQAAAQVIGVRTFPVPARMPGEFDLAFSVMARERAQALLVLANSVFYERRSQIADLAAKARLPAIYAQAQHAEAGGLMSYGSDATDGYRRAAYYVDRILKGAKPSDLPVEQPTKIDFVINLRAAKALGITIPQHVLQRADRVIE